jgi:peptidoglycan pentaglycine glycine transferase (the first glycine)
VQSNLQLTGTILAGPGQRERWDSFVSAHPRGHLLQSYAWGQFKQQHRWPAQRVLISDSSTGRPVAGAQILYREMAGLAIGYIPKGPVVDWQDRPVADELMRHLRQMTQRRRALYLKIEPNETAETGLENLLAERYGFQCSSETIQPRSTIRVDLAGGSETWLARMKPKHRYNIRLAERRGVTCRLARPSDFGAFYQLMVITGQRDQFGTHSASYYRDAWEIFQNSPAGCGSAALVLAEFEGKVIAGAMVFAFGEESAYLYGASSDEHRREMPTYLLQWKAMQWAKEQGARYYDFWGIPDEVGEQAAELENDKLEQKNVRDGLWGVYRFKQGFGGETVRYAGAFDLIYNRPLYKLWQRLQQGK